MLNQYQNRNKNIYSAFLVIVFNDLLSAISGRSHSAHIAHLLCARKALGRHDRWQSTAGALQLPLLESYAKIYGRGATTRDQSWCL